MSIIRQLLMLVIFVATIAAVGAIVFTANGNIQTETRDTRGAEIYETTTSGFEYYSKITQLTLQEPDAQIQMPVRGVRVRQVADTWGALRSGGRSHAGQDIFARRGTPIYSATAGYVLRVGESSLGGKTVFVLGKGGRRYYYAHLDDFAADLKAGDWVTTDTLLGYVGTTGNAKNTPPHLHFGVYGAGGAINPLSLLVDRA